MWPYNLFHSGIISAKSGLQSMQATVCYTPVTDDLNLPKNTIFAVNIKKIISVLTSILSLILSFKALTSATLKFAVKKIPLDVIWPPFDMTICFTIFQSKRLFQIISISLPRTGTLKPSYLKPASGKKL